MIYRILSYLKDRLFYIWLLLFSLVSVVMSPEQSLFYSVFGTFILLYLVYAYNEKIFTLLICILTATFSLYYPIYSYYGSLNSGIIAAFLETDLAESLSFLNKFQLSDLLFPFLYLIFAIVLIRLKKYNKKPSLDKKKHILHILLALCFILMLTFIPTKFYLEKRNKININNVNEVRWTLSNSPINVISFYSNVFDSLHSYFKEKQELKLAMSASPSWKILSVSPKYKNYVLIIGESARRDYLSTYGFKLKTTPFLDRSKGYINTGYISAAPGTYHSLLNTLYLTQKEKIDYSYNIITLAKAAGFDTNWLSNQGSIGKYDTIASRVGISADYAYFTRSGGFNTSHKDDFLLVNKLKEKLYDKSDNINRPRLFVLHLIGSHQNFCSRINKDEKVLEYINENLSCYVNTILKTDKLIEEVVTALKNKKESYSLIYFSDHALSYTDEKDIEKLTLDYNGKYKQSYEVPFIKLSSDDTDRQVVNTKRSAFHFLSGFSQWLGIKSKEISLDYEFFSPIDDKNIKVFNFDEMINFNELKSEPSIKNIEK